MKKEPSIITGCVSNIAVRMMHFQDVGDIESYTSGDYDHIGLVSKGTVKVHVQEITATFEYPHLILFKKHLQYKIESLEPDSIVSMIRAIRDLNTGEVKDPNLIQDEQNPFGVPAWNFNS